MAKLWQADSLEDELREEERLASAMRRRRRRRWLIPLLLVLLAVCVLFFVLYLISDPPQPEEIPETTKSNEETVTILACGDVTLTPQMVGRARTKNGYDFTEFFKPITRAVASADLALVTVEGNFCGEPYNAGKFNYPDSLLSALSECGFDIVQTANSYSIENGLTGLTSTKQAIEACGMDSLGTFSSREERQETKGILVKEVNGIRIAWIGLTKGTNGLRLPDGAEYSVNLLFTDYGTNYTKIDKEGILELIGAAKSANPDLIICSVHWGSEYSSEVSEVQKKIAVLMLENGVDVIVGSHSHRVSLIERNDMPSLERPNQKGLLAYSLGDLLSASDRKDARYGCMLKITATKEDGVVKLTDVRYLPTYSASPSEELSVNRYQVFDVLDAVSLYESSHYNRVSKALYEQMVQVLEEIKTQTACDLLDTRE